MQQTKRMVTGQPIAPASGRRWARARRAVAGGMACGGMAFGALACGAAAEMDGEGVPSDDGDDIVAGGSQLGQLEQRQIREDRCFSEVPPFIGPDNAVSVGVATTFTPTATCGGEGRNLAYTFIVNNYDPDVFGPIIVSLLNPSFDRCVDTETSVVVARQPGTTDDIVFRQSRRGELDIAPDGRITGCATGIIVDGFGEDGDDFRFATQILIDGVDTSFRPIVF